MGWIIACSEDEPDEPNEAPVVSNPLPDLSLEGGFATQTVNLSGVFSDPNGDDLTLTATSSNPQVVSVNISGTTLTINERGSGMVNITVTANDSKGGTVSDEFQVAIEVNAPPSVASELADLTLEVGFATETVDLSATFSDADGDNLTLTATSSETGVVTVAVSGTELTITEVATGSSTVTVTADDGNGGTVADEFLVTVNQGGVQISVSFGESTGTSLTINQWGASEGADGYVIVINTSNSFTDLTDGEDPAASTTYIGTDEQVVYKGTSITPFTVDLLQDQTVYYFKIFPYTGSNVYDNDFASAENETASCEITSTTESQVCFAVDVMADTRTITSNQYPSHETGSFPNADPTATNVTRVLDLTPTLAGTTTYVYDETGGPTPSNDNFWQFGMAINGVEFHPMGLKPWTNPDTGEENWEWQAQVSEEGQTHLDAWGAHVTSQGNYHYHGDIVGLADEEDGSRHSVIYGFAADGYPIYYKYSYTTANDASTAIKELTSSYQLKSGTRPGDGTTAPDGSYDGTYIQDYEYVEGLGDLDECNGRTGVTPEYPGGTYYYVITSDFPRVPNCFKGTPDEDWKIGK